MSRSNTWTWVILGGAAALAYYLESQQAQATPLSIYPELAYTATTSMAATPAQQAQAAVIPPTGLFSSVQQTEQAAVLAQCVGSNVCSPLASDTQLGI